MKVRLKDGRVIETQTVENKNGTIVEEWFCPICKEICWIYVDKWHLNNAHLEDYFCNHFKEII